MKKGVIIAIISVAAVVVIAVVLFVVVPLATSKEAEANLGEALSEAGIPNNMWSADKVSYVPILGHLVVEKLTFGDKSSGAFIEAKKVTLALNRGSDDLFAGSVDAQGLSFQADDTGITAKSLFVKDFSIDKALFKYSPFESVKKIGKINLSDTAFRQKGRRYFSLGSLNANVGYVEGKIPLSSSVSLKDLVIDIRQFVPLPTLRSEYRFSNLELKNSVSSGIYTVNLVIDGTNLFTINASLGISFPPGLLSSGDITHLHLIDYEEDVKLNSLGLTYTDKSLLDHIFELAGMSGGRERAAEQFVDALPIFTLIGGDDAERLHGELMQFIAKPGKFELKTNISTPLSFEGIIQNPLAMNVSLSINGGKPFTTERQTK